MLVDTHAHLNWDSFAQDLEQTIQRAHESGLKLIINIGVDVPRSKEVVKLQSDLVTMYATVGVHPHDGGLLNSDQLITDNLQQIEQIYLENRDKVVAIGECGLDFFIQDDKYNPSALSVEETKEWQIKLYIAQVNLAKKLGLPLSIHCRDAWDQIFVPELEGTTGVFHTFSGDADDAKQALELGYYLSFSCVITYPKNQPLRDLIKDLPMDRIVTETDCPFLPPQQLRGQRNEPAYVAEALKTIADIKGLSEQEAAEAIYQNACRLFNLP